MPDSPRLVLDRRAWQRLAGAAALGTLLPSLTACAAAGAAGAGFATQTISRERLGELVARAFPVTRSVAGGLAQVTLQSPRVSLLPASNRLATLVDVVVTERIGGTRHTGSLDLDYGVRLDMQEGAVRMSDVKVNRLSVDRLPPMERQLVSQLAPQLASRLLSEQIVYRLPPDRLQMARELGWTQPVLTVLAEGLRIDLAPAAR